jgi:hypothetical protein
MESFAAIEFALLEPSSHRPSSKTQVDVFALPPKLFFQPTLDNFSEGSHTATLIEDNDKSSPRDPRTGRAAVAHWSSSRRLLSSSALTPVNIPLA